MAFVLLVLVSALLPVRVLVYVCYCKLFARVRMFTVRLFPRCQSVAYGVVSMSLAGVYLQKAKHSINSRAAL